MKRAISLLMAFLAITVSVAMQIFTHSGSVSKALFCSSPIIKRIKRLCSETYRGRKMKRMQVF